MKWFVYACLSLLVAALPRRAILAPAPGADEAEQPMGPDDLSIW